MDPTNAYPKKELKKWRRNILLEKPEITLVLDEIHTKNNAVIQVRFHPGVDLNPEDYAIQKKGDNGSFPLLSKTFHNTRHPLPNGKCYASFQLDSVF